MKVKRRISTDTEIGTVGMQKVEKMKISMCVTAILEYDMVSMSSDASAKSRRRMRTRAE